MEAAWTSEALVPTTKLHGVRTLKTKTYVFTVLKTSNPIY
jgi:hypothetical protein